MESVRREARATQEANVALQRAAQEANKALHEIVFRLQHGESAEVAPTTRLRELERAVELQSNELSIMRREKESAAEAAQALARDWAANKSETSSSGNALYYDISSGGTGASQPGLLNSLSKNVFGYSKAPPSDLTTAPTAGGYEGSQSSLPSRQLYHMDLYDPEGIVKPTGAAHVLRTFLSPPHPGAAKCRSAGGAVKSVALHAQIPG